MSLASVSLEYVCMCNNNVEPPMYSKHSKIYYPHIFCGKTHAHAVKSLFQKGCNKSKKVIKKCDEEGALFPSSIQ